MNDPFSRKQSHDYFDGVICAFDSGSGSSNNSAPASQTVVQQTQIPAYAQQFSQENMDLARSISARPFPTYQGPRIAGFTDPTTQSFDQTQNASTAYQPAVNQAQDITAQNATTGFPQADIGAYMNPYVEASLQPQLTDLARQQGMAQLGVNQQASQAGAFGDARQGVADANNKYNYGQLAAQMIGQGYNNAFQSAQNAFQNDAQRQLQGAGQLASIGGQQQQLGLQGANALNQVGQQQQALNQQNETLAYNDFMNQFQYPIDALNLRTSVLANSPYTSSRLTTQPPPNQAAQNLGAFASLIGGAGSLARSF